MGDLGKVELVLKAYKGGVNENFVDGGKMSQYMAAVAEGECITVSGPWGMHEYLGRGVFKSGSKQLTCKKLGMIAGGTGITPMLQIAATILDDPSDTTEVSVLYANQTEDDILGRSPNLLDQGPKAGISKRRRTIFNLFCATPPPVLLYHNRCLIFCLEFAK